MGLWPCLECIFEQLLDSSVFDWRLQGEYVAEAQQAAVSFGPVDVWWVELSRYVDSVLGMAEVTAGGIMRGWFAKLVRLMTAVMII